MAKTILLVTDVDFWLNDMGSRRRIFELYKFLSQRYRVLVLFKGNVSSSSLDVLEKEFPRMILAAPINCSDAPTSLARRLPLMSSTLELIRYLRRNAITVSVRRAVAVGMRALRLTAPPDASARVPSKSIDDFYDKSFLDVFLDVCLEHQPRLVIIEYIWFSYLAKHLAIDPRFSKTVRLLDAIDVMFRRCESFQEHRLENWFHFTRDVEKRELAHFDKILAIQDSDAQEFRELAPDKQTIVVSHPANPVGGLPPTKSGCGDGIKILYLGAGNESNNHGLKKFLRSVWPSVCDSNEGRVRLDIVGRVGLSLSGEMVPDGVVIHGYVDDVVDFYRCADIVINPVQVGSGLKIKNIEALGYGKPLITTPEGARGFPIDDSSPFLIASDHQSMISCINNLVDSAQVRSALGAKALAYAQNKLNPDVCYGELVRFIEALGDE